VPQLDNPKQEAFAVNIANGMRQGDAYEYSGYLRSPSGASQLASQPHVKQRIQELIQEKQDLAVAEGDDMDNLPSELNRDWLIRTLMKNVTIAQKAQQIAPANKAVEMLAEIIGFSIKKGSSNKDTGATDPSTGEPAAGLDIDRISDNFGKLSDFLERREKDANV
jgi:hypothetical protein